MIQEFQGDSFHPKMWSSFKKELVDACKDDTRCTLEELIKAFKPCAVLLMPLYSLRYELKERFFGETLWRRAYAIRKRVGPGGKKTVWNQDEIQTLRNQAL